MWKLRFAAAAWLVALTVLSLCSARAQSVNEAGLRGTISDASGAVVPNAHITLTDVATNVAHNSASDGSGAYSDTPSIYER